MKTTPELHETHWQSSWSSIFSIISTCQGYELLFSTGQTGEPSILTPGSSDLARGTRGYQIRTVFILWQDKKYYYYGFSSDQLQRFFASNWHLLQIEQLSVVEMTRRCDAIPTATVPTGIGWLILCNTVSKYSNNIHYCIIFCYNSFFYPSPTYCMTWITMFIICYYKHSHSKSFPVVPISSVDATTGKGKTIAKM